MLKWKKCITCRIIQASQKHDPHEKSKIFKTPSNTHTKKSDAWMIAQTHLKVSPNYLFEAETRTAYQ